MSNGCFSSVYLDSGDQGKLSYIAALSGNNPSSESTSAGISYPRRKHTLLHLSLQIRLQRLQSLKQVRRQENLHLLLLLASEKKSDSNDDEKFSKLTALDRIAAPAS